MQTSSNIGDIQKWRPGQTSQLKDESILSTDSRPPAIRQSQPVSGPQTKSELAANRINNESNLTGIDETNARVDDSLYQSISPKEGSVEQ